MFQLEPAGQPRGHQADEAGNSIQGRGNSLYKADVFGEMCRKKSVAYNYGSQMACASSISSWGPVPGSAYGNPPHLCSHKARGRATEGGIQSMSVRRVVSSPWHPGMGRVGSRVTGTFHWFLSSWPTPPSIPDIHHPHLLLFPAGPLRVLQVSEGPLGPESGRPSMGSPAYTREGHSRSS